ncbi:MAG: DUF3012 domain-containing protein [Gammaproteobacteria bacterium]|nr:MAG: DUF3012 domain-containing protein [Gammaproteobacteria bacterium]
MISLKQLTLNISIVLFAATLIACTPEIGSDKWCTNMKEKPKGDWTTNEAIDYTKHCPLL